MLSLLLIATTICFASPGWESTTAAPDVLRADDVACRREAVSAQPGESLSMSWEAHRACMAEAGWVPSAARRRTERAQQRIARRAARRGSDGPEHVTASLP